MSGEVDKARVDALLRLAQDAASVADEVIIFADGPTIQALERFQGYDHQTDSYRGAKVNPWDNVGWQLVIQSKGCATLVTRGTATTFEHSDFNRSTARLIDIEEFREGGFLQEANRLFFHPLGLALEVVVEDDGTEHLGGVWDYRDDPEGVVFGDGMIEPAKVAHVESERLRHVATRRAMFGASIQDGLSAQPDERRVNLDPRITEDAVQVLLRGADLDGRYFLRIASEDRGLVHCWTDASGAGLEQVIDPDIGVIEVTDIVRHRVERIRAAVTR